MVRISALLVLGLLIGARRLTAQRAHRIELECASDGSTCRFRPGEVHVSPGESVEFVVLSGGPYVVGFQAADLSPEGRSVLNQAIPERSGDLEGPLLRGPGARFRITIPGLPKGSYHFAAVTHVAYRMGGTLIIP